MKIKYFDQNKKTKFFKWYNNDKYAKICMEIQVHI